VHLDVFGEGLVDGAITQLHQHLVVGDAGGVPGPEGLFKPRPQIGQLHPDPPNGSTAGRIGRSASAIKGTVVTAASSIGKWVLRGTFNYDFGEIIAGAEPAVFGTQYFLFDDGRVLVTEGPHAGLTPQLRALTGGGGAFSGAAGDVVEQVIGTNVTGLFNQRFTFRINKQSIR